MTFVVSVPTVGSIAVKPGFVFEIEARRSDAVGPDDLTEESTEFSCCLISINC